MNRRALAAVMSGVIVLGGGVIPLGGLAMAAPARARAEQPLATQAASPARVKSQLRARRRGKRPARSEESRPAEQRAGVPRPAWLGGGSPDGWNENPDLSRSVGVALGQSRAFGNDLTGRAGAVAYVQRGVGAFYLSWLESDQVAPAPVEAARRALDRLRENRLLSSPLAHSTEEIGYSETVSDGVARAELEWRHLSNETLSLVRGAVWLTTDGKPRLGTAECVLSTSGGEARPAVHRTCRAALATFSIAVPPGGRAALTALPPRRAGADEAPGFATVPADREAAGEARPGASTPAPGPARTGAADRVLYRGPESDGSRDGRDRWLVAFGLGLVVVAFFLLVRTRKREARAASAVAETEPAQPSGSAAAFDLEKNR